MLSDVIASNVQASLLFNDADSAKQTVDTLIYSSSVSWALLNNADGELITSYGDNEKQRNSWNSIEYTKVVLLDNEVLGELFIVTSLDKMWARVQLGMLMMSVFFGIALLIATGLVKYLSETIISPIKNLVTTSRDISFTGQYSLRTKKSSNDEIGELTDTFNAMLDLIEKNNDDLRVAATTFNAQDAIIITDSERKIIKTNVAYSTLTGYQIEDVQGQLPAFFSQDYLGENMYKQMSRSLENSGQWVGKLIDTHKEGHSYPVEYAISSVRSSDKVITHYVINFIDITDRVEAEEEIRNLAFYDPLTQLANRRLFLDRLGTVLKASLRTKQICALIFLDIDKFKLLNDSKGHGYGDKLLVQVSKRLLLLMRENDTVARLGGDEFVVLLENLGTDTMHATDYANRVGSKIVTGLNAPYLLDGYEYRSSSSVGITLAQGDTSSVESALLQADMAMYSAKNAGRNTLRFFDVTLQHAVEDKVEKEKELNLALDEEQFELYYQILVDADEQAVGAEALIRWNHPSKGIIGPDNFISLAEEMGLIQRLGSWVLYNACQQLKLWQNVEGMNKLALAINISALEFQKENFVEKVLNMVSEFAINPARLKIELTESVMLENIDFAVEKITQLKEAGISVSMDDFGTGYSSLNYLSQLPVSIVKIDRSFIARMVGSEHDISIVKMVISLGEMLNIGIVSEGIETKEQVELLKQLGCDYYQGYYFGHPVALNTFESLIQDNYP